MHIYSGFEAILQGLGIKFFQLKLRYIHYILSMDLKHGYLKNKISLK